ncbi:MAG: hypothetical protein ACEPOZ_06620 [Marinifilaceae bacterium]
MGKTFLLLVALAFASQDIVTINQQSDFITSDALGNLYCIDNTQILKYNSEGEKSGYYSNSQWGNITSADASDPLRILVFYEDFNRILFLNKQLAEIGNSIDLYQFSSNETKLVCSSAQGGFWLYDSEEDQALHISANGQIIVRSILLGSLLNETEPTIMREKGELLYLLLPGKGLLVLTQLGHYRQMLHIPGIESFQIDKDGITYLKKNKCFRFTPDSQTDPQLYPGINFQGKQLRIESGILFFGDNQKINLQTVNN